MTHKQVKGRELLNNFITESPALVDINPFIEPIYGHNFPLWRHSLVVTMQRDPRIQYGLNLLKGPIQAFTTFLPEEDAENPMLHETIREQGLQFVNGVRCKNPEVQKFIISTLNQFWRTGLQEALLAIDWGFSCSQVFYKKNAKGQILYDRMGHINPFNIKPWLSPSNELKGVMVRGIPGYPTGFCLPHYKIMWHIHARHVHHIFGEARLKWAFTPWHETWTLYGARDIRRTWFQRNAYDGGTCRYPVGKSKDASGQLIDHRKQAVEMMTQMRTGGIRIFPNEVGADGKSQKWDYEPPSANITPQGLMEYPEALRLEILEALGIPPEVIEGGGDSGFGSATGRKVPMMIYYSTLETLVNFLVYDFQRFVLNNLILVNFGKEVEYEIYKVVPLKSQEPKAPGAGTRSDPVTKTSTDTGMAV
jgi:hypothetical protein